MKTKNIAVLGSTGSIGTQTLEIIRNNKDMNVISLAARSNISLLQKQIEEFSPNVVCVFDEKKAKKSEGCFQSGSSVSGVEISKGVKLVTG